MVDKYKHTGMKDHEIFAWAVREAMAKASGLKTIEADVKDKVDTRNSCLEQLTLFQLMVRPSLHSQCKDFSVESKHQKERRKTD